MGVEEKRICKSFLIKSRWITRTRRELTRKIEECKVLNELNAGEDAISRQESEKAILSPQEKEGEGSTEITVPSAPPSPHAAFGSLLPVADAPTVFSLPPETIGAHLGNAQSAGLHAIGPRRPKYPAFPPQPASVQRNARRGADPGDSPLHADSRDSRGVSSRRLLQSFGGIFGISLGGRFRGKKWRGWRT